MIKIHKGTKAVSGKTKVTYAQYFWFTVHAKNGQVLVTSETYAKKQSVKSAIKSLCVFFNKNSGAWNIFFDSQIIDTTITTTKKKKK